MKSVRKLALVALALTIVAGATSCGFVEAKQPIVRETSQSDAEKQAALEVKAEMDGFITDVTTELAAFMDNPPLRHNTTDEQHASLWRAAMSRTYGHLTLLEQDQSRSMINTFHNLALLVESSKTPHAKITSVESRIRIRGETASIRGSGIAIGEAKPVPTPDTSGQIDFTYVGGAWKITGFTELPPK
ncbi:MAG TPA: hypothetical protein VF885_08585 [Arthrobacter sp.]